MDISLLISKQNLVDDKLIPSTADEGKVDLAIKDAQEFDLRPVLGDALYYDLVKNTTSANNQKLLQGEEYVNSAGETILFPGLKASLKYYAMARYIVTLKRHMTSHGIVEKTTPYSINSGNKDISLDADSKRSGAAAYWEDAVKYLNTKKANYPLWKCTNKTARGKIKIRAAGRR
jgi:hypothetical protein